MDYCRSTGILTIFWWTTDYIDWSFRISKKKKRVPVARPGISVLRCFSGRFSTRFSGWVSIWNPENEWWMRSWFDKSLNVLRTSCKDFGTGFYHTRTCTLYRNDTVISIHLSKKSLEVNPLEAGHCSFLSFAASLNWISRLPNYWLFL